MGDLKSYNIANCNERNIINERIQLETLLFKNNIDILVVSETWLRSNTSFWKLNGYNVIRSDRISETVGGGMMLL